MLNIGGPPPIKRLCKWGSYDLQTDEGFEKFLNEFFLRQGPYFEMYVREIELSRLTEAEKIQRSIRPDKTFPEPIDQLSPKGLALISHLYAEKDNTQKQPLIASSSRDFRSLVKLIDRASPGTEVTVILQATDADKPAHKTAFKIKKTTINIQLINMDSTSNYTEYVQSPYCWAFSALQESAIATNRIPTEILLGIQKNHPQPDGKFFSRHHNGYECGTFAIKDARQMNRDPNFVSKIIQEKNKFKAEVKEEHEHESDSESDSESENENKYYYDIPAEYLKSIESDAYAKQMLEIYGQELVTLQGKEPAPRTLEQTYEKHRGRYAHHFSKKFYKAVEIFVKQNRHDIAKIKEVTARYDAGLITLEELERRYGPSAEMKTLTETMSSTAETSHIHQDEHDAQVQAIQTITFKFEDTLTENTETVAKHDNAAVSALETIETLYNPITHAKQHEEAKLLGETNTVNDIQPGDQPQNLVDKRKDARQPLLHFRPLTTSEPEATPKKSSCCCLSKLRSYVLKSFV